jgi:hypothetical protein
VTAPLIAPVIPPDTRSSARGRRAAGAGRRLPIAAVPVSPAAPQDMLYEFGRIDAAGRAVSGALAVGDVAELAGDSFGGAVALHVLDRAEVAEGQVQDRGPCRTRALARPG